MHVRQYYHDEHQEMAMRLLHFLVAMGNPRNVVEGPREHRRRQ